MKLKLHIIILLLAAVSSFAQQPVYRHVTEDDGLPDNEIYHLYQDTKGITWISTNSGLCRYNGQAFQHFANPQLKAKSTGCIKEDAFGRIWVNNFSGQIFYVENDSLALVQLPGIKYCSNTAPFTIGPQNQLVVTSEKGEIVIYRPRHSQKKHKPDYVLDTVLGHVAQNPFYSSDNTLWASISKPEYMTNGLAATYNGHQIKYINGTAQTVQTAQTEGYAFEFNNKIYFFEREKTSLYKYNGSQFKEERRLNLPGFKMVAPLQNGRLAFCTNNGLFISDENKMPAVITTSLFPGQTISAFCEDRKGNLWVGTLTEGVYFIPNTGLTRLTANKLGVEFNNVTALATGPANRLLLGFLNGEMGQLDTQFSYTTLQPANNRSQKVQSAFYSPELQLLNWHTNNIYQAHFSATKSTLTPYRGIGYATKDMVYIPKWNAALLANPVDIQLISLDQQPITQKISGAWAAHYDTVTIFNKYMPWPQQSVLLSKERGRAVYYDEPGEAFWGADKNGITLYRQTGKINILLNQSPIFATSFCAQNGTIWAGSFSQGLFVIKNEKIVRQFLIKDGLASNTIHKILGSAHHLWIITDKGLQYFDVDKEEFFLLDKTVGLPSYKINGMALCNGYLFVSTPKGLLSIPDNIVFEKDNDRQVYLQAVYCNQLFVPQGQPAFHTNQNDFVFKVETPVYSNRALLRYRYRLKGADKDFTVTTLDNAAFEYKSLRSGKYKFELYLTDAKGNTIGQPVIYSFSIRPPFYKTTWFAGLCALLLPGLIYVVVRRRIVEIKKRGAQKLHLAQMETELKQSQLTGIKAQMNPHFMFNALNSIQEFILLNDKRQANMYMGKFADLMRMTLDMSNKNEVLLDDEVKMLRLYLELEALRFETGFTYNITTDEAVDAGHIQLPAMLIQPNIENAVKHGLLHKTGEKILDVHFAMNNPHTLCCTITDNGIGRKRSGEINAQRLKKHTSFATGATQKRLELLNFNRPQPIVMLYEDLAGNGGHATGTRVTLYIPV